MKEELEWINPYIFWFVFHLDQKLKEVFFKIFRPMSWHSLQNAYFINLNTLEIAQKKPINIIE